MSVLVSDPSSHTCAAVNGWKFPRSPEWLVLADLFDAFTKANYQNPKAYPRPFPDPNEERSGGTDLPRAKVISLLNRAGHHFTPEEED